MTKAQLIAEIQAFYTVVGTPYEVVSSDEHVPNSIKNYSVVVYETGSSEKKKKPVLNSKYIQFIVQDEGEPGELAYYANDELKNDVDRDVTSNNTLVAIHKMYASDSIRGRVQAAVSKAAQDVFNEAIPSADLATNAASGQKVINVDDAGVFWIGKKIIISDNNNYEEQIIAGITGNALTVSQNLINSYTTAANGIVRYLDDNERQQWAANALLNPDAYTLSMTSMVALNPTIQAAGGLATDNDIQFVVNSFINRIAAASYL